MANLALCCDGTWNTADQNQGGVPTPTNVVRLYNLISDKDAAGKPQLKYYHPGVGTDGGLLEKALGGGIGLGLDRNIQSGYRWLCDNYTAGDRIFLFGFSRGAYTARSLGGFVTRFGLLDGAGIDHKTMWARIEELFNKGYRVKGATRDPWVKQGWKFKASDAAGTIDMPLHFIGVWDTVGALGIPDHLSFLNLIDDPHKYMFHDTNLNKLVQHGRHALALDELRESFEPTLWTNTEGRDVKQIWFPGAHSDVGGGYREIGLSDGSLAWMIAEAEAQSLAVDGGLKVQIKPNYQDLLHNSLSDVFKLLPSKPRAIPPLDVADPAALHDSVIERCKTPPITQMPYRNTTRLKVGESRSEPIYALNPWNPTGLYLEKGAEYSFAATGAWLDRDIACGPDGSDDGKFQPSEVVQMLGSLIGKGETLFKRITNTKASDFWLTKRHEEFPWFALIGVIANGLRDGQTAALHETLLIGKGVARYKVAGSGYLYAYANDAWNFYDNNRGSVTLTVKRLS